MSGLLVPAFVLNCATGRDPEKRDHLPRGSHLLEISVLAMKVMGNQGFRSDLASRHSSSIANNNLRR